MTILFRSGASEHAQHASRTHTAVHLLRWDDVFQEWDHEASFRLWWRAELAAKALTAANSADTYAVADARNRPLGEDAVADARNRPLGEDAFADARNRPPGEDAFAIFFQNGHQIEQPAHTLPEEG